MVGQDLELELYKAKNITDFAYLRSSIKTKKAVKINTDGKIIVEFELQKDWANDHKTHKYFYVGAESDTFGSYFTKELHSDMLLAYQEGDELKEGISLIDEMKQTQVLENYPDISLAKEITFFGYQKSDSKGCYRRCQDMLYSIGYASVIVTDKTVIQMTKYKSSKEQVLVIQKGVRKGIDIINKHLNDGKPIMVGTDHALGHTGNYDETTDHWILIVGRKTDKEGVHFLFFDPQTGHKSIGTSPDNKLTIQNDFTLKGKYRGKNYTVTMVRPTIKK